MLDPITLVLSRDEAEYLADVLEWWQSGMKDALDATVEDQRTLDTIEKLLDASAGIQELETKAESLSNRIKEAVVWPKTI